MKKRSKFRIPHIVIVRAPGLLPMMYTLSELGLELGIPYSTLRNWLDAGAPHERDKRGHIFVNGQDFAAWVKEKKRTVKHRKLEADEGYCMHCNQVVQMLDTEIHRVSEKLSRKIGSCPECGGKVIRGDRNDKSKELSDSK